MQGLSSLFARRYLFARKSHSVINIISVVSAFAVGVPVAAMVILLSVFNGFEGLVRTMFKAFDPDILITVAEGKTFPVERLDTARLRSLEEIEVFSGILEENGLLEYGGKQYVGTLRGVDANFKKIVPLDEMIVAGTGDLYFGELEQAVVGQTIAYNLGIRTNLYESMRIYAPRRGAFSTLLPIESFRRESLFPAGVFALEAETDQKYLIAPIAFTQRLFDYPDRWSSVMVKLKPGIDPNVARRQIAATVGNDFRVLTRYQQKASLYKIMTYEKWGVFFIGLLVLVIASFSVIGSLIMLIIEKRKDIRTLVTFGGTVRFVRSIFIREGMLISTIGAAGGMALGVLFCLLQQQFGFIRIPAETFLVDAYPVVIQAGDLLGIAATFLAVNIIIATFTTRMMIPKSTIRL